MRRVERVICVCVCVECSCYIRLFVTVYIYSYVHVYDCVFITYLAIPYVKLCAAYAWRWLFVCVRQMSVCVRACVRFACVLFLSSGSFSRQSFVSASQAGDATRGLLCLPDNRLNLVY